MLRIISRKVELTKSMRLLLSPSCSFWMSRVAVLRARELGAAWASVEEMPVKGEPDCWLDDFDHIQGGYSLSHLVPRNDPILLQVFDELGGDKMSYDPDEGIYSVNVPDDLRYFVGSYISEWIAEAHRVWNLNYSPDGDSGGGPVFTKDSKYSDFSQLEMK